MLSEGDVKAIEVDAGTVVEMQVLRRWIDDLLRDRRERVEQTERTRQRLKPFAYSRDLIKST